MNRPVIPDAIAQRIRLAYERSVVMGAWATDAYAIGLTEDQTFAEWMKFRKRSGMPVRRAAWKGHLAHVTRGLG
jgi:hypothetical protein